MWVLYLILLCTFCFGAGILCTVVIERMRESEEDEPFDPSANPKLKSCDFCGGYHLGACPYVAAVEYSSPGIIRRVEFRKEHYKSFKDVVFFEGDTK